MGEQQIIASQFNRADLNHDGTIDEQEFRQFLGPVKNYNRLSANINYQDIQNLNVSIHFLFIILIISKNIN